MFSSFSRFIGSVLGLFQSHRTVVCAIDFGTTYSSWGFSFGDEFMNDPTDVSPKDWKSPNRVSLKGYLSGFHLNI